MFEGKMIKCKINLILK